MTNDRSVQKIYGLVHSTDIDPAEVTSFQAHLQMHPLFMQE